MTGNSMRKAWEQHGHGMARELALSGLLQVKKQTNFVLYVEQEI
jgi:uncharacterized beta-barrel protein YwiB (DUF1934 family)